ncbi:MAG: bifunctional folylpolyglutamate synthase/dihydrofolate synthase [Nitrospirota bacterium]|jgi:dihydrofolate synthase/folylpolyglutamate synthase
MGYTDTIQYLYALGRHGTKLGLHNTTELLARFGNPQRRFRSVHIAGTNGKGSTAACLAAMLKQGGARVGLFTSPHLVSFTERMTVDGVEITEAEVVSLAREVRGRSGGLTPTFFEVVTVMGFLHFARAGVDWAVVETGLGGRLDATNVLAPALTIITTLGMDHREFLGERPEDIAREKAGIIKPGVPVVTAPHGTAEMAVIREAALSREAPLHVAGKDFQAGIKARTTGGLAFEYRSDSRRVADVFLPLAGDYQALNASLAIRAFELLAPEKGELAGLIRAALASLRWPGRLQVVGEDPPVLIDGAHNPDAARALAEALREGFLRAGERLTLLAGVMADKDIKGILGPLLPLASRVIFAAPAFGRSAEPRALREAAASLGFASEAAPSVGEALQAARQGGDPVLVTGSFYTIGEAMETLGTRGTLSRLREWHKPV